VCRHIDLPNQAIPDREFIMKTNYIMSAIVAIAATAAFATSMSASAAAAPVPLSFLGSAAPATAAERTITINADTKYINVTGGTTVRFVVGDQSFTWSFQTGGTHIVPFDLGLLAPAGTLNHRVVVYVADNPLYVG
jgi:hypothetical protein